ncbi:MAG: hypothetical protein IPH57_14830 [Saprospiraceae bacterium]|nr:hypothetical protein [Saprospiraceae bacterium]
MKVFIKLFIVLFLFSCYSDKEDLNIKLLNETISTISRTNHFFFFYPPSPEDSQKYSFSYFPRLNIVFSNKFEKEKVDMLIAFNAITQNDTANIKWKYIPVTDSVPAMNFDTIRTYHYIDMDSIYTGYSDDLGKKGYFGILQFLKPIEIKSNNKLYYVTGIKRNGVNLILIFQKLDSGLKIIGSKSIGFGLLE